MGEGIDMSDKAKNLRGDRNQCSRCFMCFNSTAAFDKHRVGEHANNGRRCLSADEMIAKGMVLREDGFWRGSAMPESAREAIA